MSDQQNTIKTLRQTNRLLMFGYMMLGVLAMAGYAIAQTRGIDDDEEETTEDTSDAQVLVVNNEADSQPITAVESESGFAVYVDAGGEINVIHRDGTVIVPTRKVFSHAYQEDEARWSGRTIVLPAQPIGQPTPKDIDQP